MKYFFKLSSLCREIAWDAIVLVGTKHFPGGVHYPGAIFLVAIIWEYISVVNIILRGNSLSTSCPRAGGQFPGLQFSGGNYPGGNCPGRNYLGGNYPGGNCPVRIKANNYFFLGRRESDFNGWYHRELILLWLLNFHSI